MIVAIKIIDKINLNLKQLQNIINEINILKQINYHHHPNIIELLGLLMVLIKRFNFGIL